MLAHAQTTQNTPPESSGFVTRLRRHLAFWIRGAPDALYVSGNKLIPLYFGGAPFFPELRKYLGGGIETTIYETAPRRSGERVAIVAPCEPAPNAPQVLVKTPTGVRPVRGPVAVVGRTDPGGFTRKLARDDLRSIALVRDIGSPAPVLTVLAPGVRERRANARLQWRLRWTPRISLAAIALLRWYFFHTERPANLEGEWVGSFGDPTSWTQVDTIRLGPGDYATRRAWAVWHGGHNAPRGPWVPDTLDLSGPYSWGVNRQLSGPPKLCLWPQESSPRTPPSGCLPLVREGNDLVLGAVRFRRIPHSSSN